MELRLSLALPFDHKIIAYVVDNFKNRFVIVERPGHSHPFVTYRLEADGSDHPSVIHACEHGFYTDTKSRAWNNLLGRANFSTEG